MIGAKLLQIAPEQVVSTNIPEDDAPAWSAVTTYAALDRVMRNHRVYESRADDNTGNEPPSLSHWTDLGATNRYRMFDGKPEAASQRTGYIDVTVQPGRTFNAIALINVGGAHATVQVLAADGTVLQSLERSLTIPKGSWHALWFEPPTPRREVIMLWTATPPDARVRIVINAGSGVAWCGEVCIGRQHWIGDTLFDIGLGIRDFSVKETDAYGNASIREGRYSDTVDFAVALYSSRVEPVRNFLAAARATAMLYVGSQHRPETVVYGFFKDLRITIPGPVRSRCALELESLSYKLGDELYSGAAVSIPAITVPSADEAMPVNGVLRASAFGVTGGSDTHLSSDWQFAEDDAFLSLVVDLAAETDHLTELPLSAVELSVSDVLYARGRYTGATLGTSPWSTPVRFTVGAAASVSAPVITTSGEIQTSQAILASAFMATPPDDHYATDWIITTGVDPVFELSLTAQHLTSLPVPAELAIDVPHTVVCRYHGRRSGASAWSAPASITPIPPRGQAKWVTPGSHAWVVPPGVTSVSAVCVGSGAPNSRPTGTSYYWQAGGGGALRWATTIAVTPGETLIVDVRDGDLGGPDGAASIKRGGWALLYANGGNRSPGADSAGTPIGGVVGGCNGGRSGDASGFVVIGGVPHYGPIGPSGGGPAGGYSGTAGSGAYYADAGPDFEWSPGSSDSGGGAGGTDGQDGGGTGIHGTGERGITSGAPGSPSPGALHYGGGAGGSNTRRLGRGGAVRIIWGANRAYPNTNTGDV